MIKKDIVNYLYEHHGAFSKKECEKLVDLFFESIKDGLRRDKNVKISKFGTFYVKKYGGRNIVHPITGKKIKIETHNVVSFRKSKQKNKT